jgi:prophage antirepressor-like protein
MTDPQDEFTAKVDADGTVWFNAADLVRVLQRDGHRDIAYLIEQNAEWIYTMAVTNRDPSEGQNMPLPPWRSRRRRSWWPW